MLLSVVYAIFGLLLNAILSHRHRDRDVELLVLRHQLNVLERTAARASARTPRLGGVHPSPGRHRSGLRLLHRRYRSPPPVLRLLLHRALDPTRVPGRLHGPPRWSLGHSASPQSVLGIGDVELTARILVRDRDNKFVTASMTSSDPKPWRW